MLEKYFVLWKTHRGRIYTTPLFNAVTSLTIVCENKQKAWSPLHTLPINHWNTRTEPETQTEPKNYGYKTAIYC